jgi:hypothetical protein
MGDIPLNERFESYDDILRHLTAMLLRQQEFNAQQVEISRDIKTAVVALADTLPKIEALLAEILRPHTNGPNA